MRWRSQGFVGDFDEASMQKVRLIEGGQEWAVCLKFGAGRTQFGLVVGLHIFVVQALSSPFETAPAFAYIDADKRIHGVILSAFVDRMFCKFERVVLQRRAVGPASTLLKSKDLPAGTPICVRQPPTCPSNNILREDESPYRAWHAKYPGFGM
ncbi:hypothetical protein [Paraburkholderia strydomiana]|uniref:hypothetical protein n=1 Tax=Paraburkholderia strydomiana TaxID=1245417 RepID=UPI0038B780A1